MPDAQAVWLVSKPLRSFKVADRKCSLRHVLDTDPSFRTLLRANDLLEAEEGECGYVLEALVLLQEGTSTIGFSDYTQELSVEELWMCRVFFNERLNFANVLDVACLQSDMALAPTPMNVLAEELQMHLFRLSPVFMSELFGNPCVLDQCHSEGNPG